MILKFIAYVFLCLMGFILFNLVWTTAGRLVTAPDDLAVSVGYVLYTVIVTALAGIAYWVAMLIKKAMEVKNNEKISLEHHAGGDSGGSGVHESAAGLRRDQGESTR